MVQTAPAFKHNLIRKITKRALAIARPLIPSRTLRKALVARYFQGGGMHLFRSWLVIPHYWALYVHDGRGGFGPRKARVLVWFKDPRNDPRTSGGTEHPVRAADIRRLTKSEFYFGVKMNRLHGSPDNPMPYMVIARQRRGDNPKPFFSEGLRGLDVKISSMVKTDFQRFVRSNLISDKDDVNLKF